MLSYFKEVEICDELESFFYVILYYAVRYLRSNIPRENVGDWIHYFFDTYGVSGDTYVCGQVKLNAIKHGELVVTPDELLKFGSPMDNLLADLLNQLQAHHAVTIYEIKRNKLEAIPEVVPEPSGTHSEALLGALQLPDGINGPDFALRQPSTSLPGRRTKQEPSEEEKQLHESVLTHTAMLERLHAAIQPDQPWTSDKLGCLVSKDYKPPKQQFGPAEPASFACVKRAKLDEQTGKGGALHLSA